MNGLQLIFNQDNFLVYPFNPINIKLTDTTNLACYYALIGIIVNSTKSYGFIRN